MFFKSKWAVYQDKGNQSTKNAVLAERRKKLQKHGKNGL